MRKLIVVFTSMALILCACTDSRVTFSGDDPDVYWVTAISTTRADGMYFLKDLGSDCVLWYADFSNCDQVVVCPKPNCTHNDPETCYALGVTSGAGGVLPYDGKIYWLDTVGRDSVIYRANADGTERSVVCTIENRLCYGWTLCAVNDKMYFETEDLYDDGYGEFLEKRSTYLYSYSFENGELTELSSFLDMFPNADKFNCSIDGVWNGGIYLSIIALAEKSSATKAELVYDISKGTLEKSDLDPWEISGEYMILLNGSTVRVIHESGKEYEFKNIGASVLSSSVRIVNGYLFIADIIIDIETGTRYENLAAKSQVQTYRNGKYLIYNSIEYTFEMVPESKVIGAEIE